jgi:hypothetical protein
MDSDDGHNRRVLELRRSEENDCGGVCTKLPEILQSRFYRRRGAAILWLDLLLYDDLSRKIESHKPTQLIDVA